MSTVNPESVYQLFIEVRELPEDARDEFLRSRCHDRPALLEEVQLLLSGNEGVLSFLDQAPLLDGETFILEPQLDSDQQEEPEFELNYQARSSEIMIGPYQLIEQIGEGGMGIVYRAVQYQPVQREVALKVIKPGLSSKEVIARFEAERQALAMMDHPHIARVFDGGTTDDGRPYFAMELVRGTPITEYCNLNQLHNTERLKLFRNVCDAVQHAHQKGIIHRDLKPSNIMVTKEDDEPRIKVIDFGIAKALSQPLTDRTLLTGVLFVLGTPMYMSPEQADLSCHDIDTRSDIYSLGVLLYELLAGLLPFEMDTLAASRVDAYLRVIREEEPKRPSSRIMSLDDKKLSILCAQRQLEVRKFTSLFRGELDWIVMKAIEKDRARRYQSARELSQDLGRYLEGEPVLASPQSTLYRLKKYCRRHRVVMVTSTLVALALVVGFSTAIWQALRAFEAERIAAERAVIMARMLYAERMETAFERHLAGEYDSVQKILEAHRPKSPADVDFRGYEWYLLDNQPEIPVETILEARGRIRTLQYHPESGRLAVGNSFGDIILFDLATSRKLATHQGHANAIYDFCFLGRDRLVSCGEDGTVAFWNLAPLARDAAIEEERRFPLSQEVIYALEYDEALQKLYVAGDETLIRVIDLNSMTDSILTKAIGRRIETLQVIPGEGMLAGSYDGTVYHIPANPGGPVWRYSDKASMGGVKEIAYLPDLRLAVSGQLNGQITLFDESSPDSVRFSQVFPSDVHCVALSPDGKWIAAGVANGNICMMPTIIEHDAGYLDSGSARRRRMRIWNAHDKKVEQIFFLPSEEEGEPPVLVSSSRDGTVRVSRPFGRRWGFQLMDSPLRDFEFLPDGTLLLAGDDVVRHEISEGLNELSRIDETSNWRSVLVTANSREIFLDRRRTEIFQAALSGRPPRLFKDLKSVFHSAPNELISRWAVSPDGSLLVVNVEYQNTERYRFEFYRLGEEKPFHTISDESLRLTNDLVFSPDGNRLALIQNNDIWLMDPHTGAQIAVLGGHRDTIRDLDFSPDGLLLASVSNDQTLKVWDVADPRLLWSTNAHENRAANVTFHPTLHTLATAGEDGILRFWQTLPDIREPESRLVGVLPLDAGRPRKIAFSPDGQDLVIRHELNGLTVLRASPIDGQ